MLQDEAERYARQPVSSEAADDLSRCRAALEASGDVFYEWNLASDRLTLAGRAARLFPADPAALPLRGADFNAWIHPEDLPRRLAALAQHLDAGRTYDCQYRLCGADGGFRWVHDCGAAFADPRGRAIRLAGSLRLVSEGAARATELAQQGLYDPATGDVQRQPLHRALDRVFAAGERAGWCSAVAVLGIDWSAGAAAARVGDAVLLEMGRRLDRHLRGGDVIGRLAGDRFGLLLGRCDAEAAQLTLERIVEVLQRDPVRLDDGSISARLSAGVVLVPAQARSGLEALSRAEQALARARARGGGAVALHRPAAAQRQNHARALRAAHEVREALDQRRLRLAFQPVVDPRSGEALFHEGLLRRCEPDGRVTAAGAFIAQIEPLGLMGGIDRRVLELSLAELERDPAITLAFNISGLTAADPAWYAALARALTGRPELGPRLIVEITETASLHDLEEAAGFVRRLHDLGVRVAIDDFGAGCTSAAQLVALDADLVKIDAAFSAGIRSHPQKQVFLQRLLDLAGELGLTTVAEGIENAADAAFLGALGVDLLQGYHFGTPTLTPSWMQAETS
ncbi:MAG: EAL domain-containing protein [Kiloniellales bacterium]|nr:EAL domain-containing protein [Kiloniellales bacterium]